MNSRARRAPQQDRSRRTLDLLAGAAESVLRRRTFGEASLQEIVDGAGVTTGAFYARFRAKDDLLRHLEERINGEIQATTWRLAALESEGGDPVEFFRGAITDLVDIYKRNRGALRALIERSRSDAALRDRRLEYARESFLRVEDAMTRIAGDGAPEFRTRARVGMLFVTGTLREVFLYHEFWPADMRPSDEVLIEELVTAFFAYLDPETQGRTP